LPLPRRLKKTVLAALAVVCAASLPFAGVMLFQELYKKQLWDPRHAAQVNGRPVTRDQVEAVLKIGLYPPLAAESGEPGTITMRQILDGLIEEELVMQASEREGLGVTEEEVDAFLDAHLDVWGCGGGARRAYMCRVPRGEELEMLKSALRRRLVLEKAAYFAVGRRARRDARDWERYLSEWSGTHYLPRVYEARALLAEKVPVALRILRSERSRSGGLQRLEEDLKAAGAGCMVSDPIMIDPAKASPGFQSTDLEEGLRAAAGVPSRLTPVMELEESYAVLEVLNEVAPPTPEDMVRAARVGYEGRVAEAAFRAFVSDLWAQADIEINPNFPGAVPAAGPSSVPPAAGESPPEDEDEDEDAETEAAQAGEGDAPEVPVRTVAAGSGMADGSPEASPPAAAGSVSGTSDGCGDCVVAGEAEDPSGSSAAGPGGGPMPPAAPGSSGGQASLAEGSGTGAPGPAAASFSGRGDGRDGGESAVAKAAAGPAEGTSAATGPGDGRAAEVTGETGAAEGTEGVGESRPVQADSGGGDTGGIPGGAASVPGGGGDLTEPAQQPPPGAIVVEGGVERVRGRL
jgi:hypothetical protein